MPFLIAPRALLDPALFSLLPARSAAPASPPTPTGARSISTPRCSLLNPYGTWAQINGRVGLHAAGSSAALHQRPLALHRVRLDWKGDQPHSWLTEHYGYWKRGADKVWSWYPGAFWLPQIVEIRAARRLCRLAQRRGRQRRQFCRGARRPLHQDRRVDFVSNRQFAGPITPAVMAKPGLTSRAARRVDRFDPHLPHLSRDRPPRPASGRFCRPGRRRRHVRAQGRK